MTRRVLALHGYSQNSAIFVQKTGALRRALRKEKIEIEYIDAPKIVENQNPNDTDPIPKRGWFTFSDTNYFGVEDALDLIRKELTEKEYEGIIAFSQGACLAGLFCAIQENSEQEPNIYKQLKYVVICSGFLPRIESYATKYYSKYLTDNSLKISIPSFHFYGSTDAIILPEKSIQLAGLFKDPVIYEHPGGHFIPANAQPMRTLREFIAKNSTTKDKEEK